MVQLKNKNELKEQLQNTWPILHSLALKTSFFRFVFLREMHSVASTGKLGAVDISLKLTSILDLLRFLLTLICSKNLVWANMEDNAIISYRWWWPPCDHPLIRSEKSREFRSLADRGSSVSLLFSFFFSFTDVQGGLVILTLQSYLV